MASSFKAFYNREGRLRLFAPFGMPLEQLFSDVQRLTLEPTLPVVQKEPAACQVAG